jgi:hypothetical protein
MLGRLLGALTALTARHQQRDRPSGSGSQPTGF